MDRLSGLRRASWPWLIVLLCVVVATGCQDGSGPRLAAAPDVKSAPEGKKPQPPPADPAIAFVVGERIERENWTSLRVMNADGSNQTTIYSTPGGQFKLSNPSWSPDGESIVFACHYDLWLVDVSVIGGTPTGLNPRLLLDREPTGLYSPEWSPGGEQIAFIDYELSTLETIPAAGGEPSVLYTSACGCSSPTWSYDGTRIAFQECMGGQSWAIQVIDVVTREITTVLDPEWGGAPLHLDWANTQDVLTFSAGSSRGHDLAMYTLQLPSGSPELILEDAKWPTWSPDDSEILHAGRCIYQTLNLTTQEITRIRTNPAGSWGEDWRRF